MCYKNTTQLLITSLGGQDHDPGWTFQNRFEVSVYFALVEAVCQFLCNPFSGS